MSRVLTDRNVGQRPISQLSRQVRRGWWSQAPSRTVDAPPAAVTLTADTTAHTKGAWSEVIASTSADADLLWVRVAGIGSNAVDTASLIDIGVGSAGAESAIVSNIAVGHAAATGSLLGIDLWVPVYVPKGSRIAARMQSVVTGGKTGTIRIGLYASLNPSLMARSVDVIGTSTATSAGTALSNSANAYVELTSSTSRAYSALVVVPSASSTTTVSAAYTATVAVGAAGSEVDLGAVLFRTTTGELLATEPGPNHPVIRCDIPAGVRLAVKGDTANMAVIDATVIGIPRIA